MGEYLHAVYEAGARYGMELHSDKFQLLPVQSSTQLVTPEGKNIPAKNCMEYLGTTLYSDGAQGHELNRRIGAANSDFETLSKVWQRSACTWRKKFKIFNVVIESKLLYSL